MILDFLLSEKGFLLKLIMRKLVQIKVSTKNIAVKFKKPLKL